MTSNQPLLTTGEFAALHHINKRTLHYYDSIGLFSPSATGENGYRYYSYLQSAALEMILTLRELGMSIEEISAYQRHPSAPAFHQILAEKTAEIDENLKRLKELRRLLAAQERQLCTCEETDLDRIEVLTCPREYLQLSGAITGTYDDGDLAVFTRHAHATGGHRLFNKSYGSMISVPKIQEGRFGEDDCFFTRMEKSAVQSGLFVKPEGTYLRAYSKGDWDKLPAAYHRLLAYAAAHRLTLQGYLYEEGLNEMAISSMADYVTQITVRCTPAQNS
ncbi:MAG: MerR family transcriptional regulator [Oscillospiraceae bacterium]